MFDNVACRLDDAGQQHHVIGQAMAAYGLIFVLMAGIGELNAERADIRLVQHGKNQIERDVEYMRTVPVAPTAMQAHAIAWNSFDGFVDCGNMHLASADELCIR